MNMIFVLFLSILICGCVAGTQGINKNAEQAEEQNGTQSISFKPIKDALHAYNSCLDQKAQPYLYTKIKPKTIADRVTKECEPKLSDYKSAITEVYAKVYNHDMREYQDILKYLPQKHATRVREKGKHTLIAKVVDARESAQSEPKQRRRARLSDK